MNCIEGHKHCWHTGSGFDSGSYTQQGGYTITHFMCCWCGHTRTEKTEWTNPKGPVPVPHGTHGWSEYQGLAAAHETIQVSMKGIEG